MIISIRTASKIENFNTTILFGMPIALYISVIEGGDKDAYKNIIKTTCGRRK